VEKEGVSVQKLKVALQQMIQKFETEAMAKGSIIQIDVDPY